MPASVPATVSKQSLYNRVRREARTKRELKERTGSLLATLATAAGGGFVWGKFPEFRALGTAGGTQAGIDSRVVVGAGILGVSMFARRMPRYTQDIAEVLLTTAAWDYAKSKGEGA